MNTSILKGEIYQMVDELDERLLQAVHAFLQTYQASQTASIVGYDTAGNALSGEEAAELYQQRIKAMKDGAVTTIEGLKKEV